MLDTLQVIFWSITYVLVIIAGFRSRNIRKVSMPYLPGILNFAWELSAAYHSGGMWSHALWLSLDVGIVFFGFLFLKSGRERTNYAAAILVSFLCLLFLFAVPMGMTLSVFAIDLIMAVCYLAERRNLSPELKLPIAVTKLLGDAFAGLYYGPQSLPVGIMAGIVFVCNCRYLYLCLKERKAPEKSSKEKRHSGV